VPNEWTPDADSDAGMNKPVYEIPVTPPQRPSAADPASADAGFADPSFAAPAASAPADEPAAGTDPMGAGAPEEPLPWYLRGPVEPLPPEALRSRAVYDLSDDSAQPTHIVSSLPNTPPAETPATRPRRTQRVDGAPQADQELLDALQEVLYLDGSDLHVTVDAPPNLRVNGSLRPLDNTERWSREKVQSALFSLLTPEQREQFERELELDFAYTAMGARFRVNYYQQRNSIGGAFRLIPQEIKQLKDLGVPESVGRFAALARGLVLVTGPTGSGKSTTLAALIDQVNRTRADHIVTVEDPIEFLHRHQKSLVNQREVGSDTHSFAAALKHVLRQDPDVILIGELRDLETISVALTAAETGHLVFATLHTQSAAQTIDRIIDVFPPHQQSQVRSQLAATLQGVICQTLVKRVDSGRAVATEVLFATSAIANLIREGKTYQISSAMQAGRDQGMHSMDQHLANLVNSGIITRKSAEEKAQDVASLSQLIRRTEHEEPVSLASAEFDYDAYGAGN
jgi:pilus retraction protein PilT